MRYRDRIEDALDISLLPIPEGKIAEWKVVELLGEPVPKTLVDDYLRAGWEPFPPNGAPREAFGCRLMVRDRDLHEAALREVHEKAETMRREAADKGQWPDAQYTWTDWGWAPTAFLRELERIADASGRADLALLSRGGDTE